MDECTESVNVQDDKPDECSWQDCVQERDEHEMVEKGDEDEELVRLEGSLYIC